MPTGWYPGDRLDTDETLRSRKVTKFDSIKWVFPKKHRHEMRGSIGAALYRNLPEARWLY